MQYTRYRGAGYYSSYFPPGIKWLLIVNVAIFLLDYFAKVLFSTDWSRLFALVPILVLDSGMVWQFVTYMFFHADLTHILVNMLMLWMFGMDLERDWGTSRFLRYYFLCGIAAGFCVFAVALLQPSGMVYGTLGASGAIFGLLLAYGVLYADRIILMFFLFPMKAKYAVMIFGAIEFLLTFQGGGTVSHVAHLGGMLFGYVYLKTGLSRVKVRVSPLASLRRQYEDWKLRRARRKFQVYMKKHDRDRWTN